MAHKKAGGSTKNGRDSNSKRRGVKRYDGQVVTAGEIIVRQVGATWKAGENVYLGRDYTVHAGITGIVRFQKSMGRIAIEPIEQASE